MCNLFCPSHAGIADKAYVGCPELICEFKGKEETLLSEQIEFNLHLQWYRARTEHLIGDVKKKMKIFKQPWGGSYTQMSAMTRM